MREVAVAVAAQVEQATGGGDEHVDASAKRLGLRLVADAAVDDGDAVLGVLGRLAGDAVDLQRELAGRGDDERARRLVAAGDALQERQDERRGLAGAGLRATDDVLAGDDGRDSLFLDGGGRGIAHVTHGIKNARVETQVVETQV